VYEKSIIRLIDLRQTRSPRPQLSGITDARSDTRRESRYLREVPRDQRKGR
jgi:hypothetical protein